MTTVKTERLTIRPCSNDEMRVLIENAPDEDLKAAYGEMLSLCLQNPAERQWYAAWKIVLSNGTDIGDLCFKGLSPDGAVEIGYGLDPEYWGKGYATEAVSATVAWAFDQPGVQTVEAETDPDNVASQRVLAKAGFLPTGKMGEEGPRFARKKP